jgi:AcrR family transcriptional regulator
VTSTTAAAATRSRAGARIAGRTAADLAAEVATHAHGRVPRDLRLAHVLAVATDLFIERGYQQASMDELARRAGVSKPVVYDLVGSKEEVFRRVMTVAADELAERIRLAVSTADDAAQQLRAGAQAFFAFVDERSGAWGALMHGSDAPVTEAVGEIRSRQARLLSELFVAAAGDGADAATARLVELVAHTVNGAFEAAAAWWHEHQNVPVDDVAELVLGLLEPGLLALGSTLMADGA